MVEFNKIIAIIGFIFGLIAVYDVSRLAIIITALEGRVIVGIIIGILGLVGIYLFDKDYKIAVVEYILAGFGLTCTFGDYGIIAFIIFVIAGIIAFFERGKSKANKSSANKSAENVHYFGEQPQEAVQETGSNGFNTRILWIVPVITLILSILYI